MGWQLAARDDATAGALAPGSTRPETTARRLASVDVARAVAIVLMLQGHFVALTLAPRFRDLSDPVYLTHARLRGLTAPLFLTVSGLVFVYYLGTGAQSRGWAHPRVRRGLRRGLLLLVLGYVLRFDLAGLWQAGRDPFARMAGTHVLHVVGVGLWVLSVCWLWLGTRRPALTCAALFSLGLAFFVATGWVRSLDLTALPAALSSYLVPVKGAEFSLFPWLGYVSIGGACGALLLQRTRDETLPPPPSPGLWPIALLALAAALHVGATPWVFRLHRACGEGPLCDALPPVHNFLHPLSWVLALLGLLMGAEPLLKRRTPRWLSRTGQHTLLVFVAHAVLLYGAFTGLGVAARLRDQLTPLQAALGAFGFVALHVTLVQLWALRSAVGVPALSGTVGARRAAR